jgi:transcriptional regulator with XRE-family HTH domain
MARKQWTARRHVTHNNLKVLRAARGWTQGDVAERLGLPSRYRYWQVENEEIEPTKRELKKLCRIFRCTPEEIFPPGFRAVAS